MAQDNITTTAVSAITESCLCCQVKIYIVKIPIGQNGRKNIFLFTDGVNRVIGSEIRMQDRLNNGGNSLCIFNAYELPAELFFMGRCL